ncbi:MAG: hypothetical protein U0Q22_10750 [Acidimicrobiales bacterium]
MNTRTVRLLAVTTIAGLGLGAAVVPAGASPAKPVNIYTKAKCNQAINERLFVLTISENRIATVKRLTADQKASEIAGIDAVKANLVNVNRPALNSAVGTKAIRAACAAIYSDNRVYAVVIPQLFASVRIDEFSNAFDKFNPLIAEKKAAGADTAAIEALMASAATHVDTAAGLSSGVTVASYNADPAAARAAFASAVDELNAALGDVLHALVAYRDLPAAP